MTHYTPTHTAEGRKLTKAERRAANKAKWAALRTDKPKADKPKRKPTRAERRAANKAAWAAVQAAKEANRKPTANERLEAQAQRASIRTQEDKRAKERAKATKVVSAIDGGEAMPFEPRVEVEVEVQERKRPALESVPLSEYDGLTLVEASNLRKLEWMQAQEEVCLEDCL